MKFVRKLLSENRSVAALVFGLSLVECAAPARAQVSQRPGQARPTDARPSDAVETTGDWNRRIEQLNAATPDAESASSSEYRIGANDVLEVNVFGAPELNEKVRVSAAGDISMPLTGAVRASGLSAQELESALERKLQAYLNEPHVGVFVASVESHPVSVLGEVNKPGVFQVRGPKTLLEMLSMAQGLADDAGNTVRVMRGAGLDEGEAPPSAPGPQPDDALRSESSGNYAVTPDHQKTIEIDLKLLLDSGDARYNVPIYPGDIIKVAKAGIVYVVGGVKRPGGFAMRSNEEMSLLKAIALAEGVNDTAAKSRTRIIHTDEISGRRSETPVDLGKILAGKAPDLPLKPADIVFVPRSNAKSALLRGTETTVATASGFVIFHP
jgi:polysaccharide biosynthesis/export protein